MDFEKINADDTLNQGRIKINNILDAAKSQVSELKGDLAELEEYNSLEYYQGINTEIGIDNAFMKADGVIANDQNEWCITRPIEAIAGDIFKFALNGYGRNVAVCFATKKDGTWLKTLVTGKTDGFDNYIYEVEATSYICFCYRKENTIGGIKNEFPIDVSVKRKIKKNLIHPNVVAGKFLNQNGQYSNNSTYNYTEPIYLPPYSTLEAHIHGVSGKVATVAITNEDGSMRYPKMIADDSDKYVIKTYSDDLWVFLSYDANYINKVYLHTNLDDLKAEWTEFVSKSKYMQIFNNILCIGDSLTAGFRKSGVILKDKSYPSYLAKDATATVVNGGVAGIYPTLWYSQESDKYNYSDYDCVFIFLGTNQGLTDTLDVDVVGDNYENYANTNTGRYCSIIEKIKAQNPNAKIFLIGVWNDITYQDGHIYNRDEITNTVIKKIADKYNLPFLDIFGSDYVYLSHPKYHNLNSEWLGSHFNTLSYKMLEQMIASSAGKYILEHLVDYEN